MHLFICGDDSKNKFEDVLKSYSKNNNFEEYICVLKCMMIFCCFLGQGLLGGFLLTFVICLGGIVDYRGEFGWREYLFGSLSP